MSEYGKLLAYGTVWDIVYNILLGLFIIPDFLFPVPGIYFNGLGENLCNLLGQEIGGIILASFIFCLVGVVEIQIWCLIYRFTVVHRNQKIHRYLMSIPGVIATLVLGISICFFIAVPLYLTVIVAGEKVYEVLKRYPEDSYINILSWADIVIFDITHPAIPYLISIIGVMFVIAQLISISCCWYVIRTLKKNSSSYTERTSKINLQLTRVLSIQLIIPIISAIFPVINYVILVLLKVDFPIWWGEILIFLLALFPLASVTVNIVFITPYWNFTRKWIINIFIKLKIINKPQEAVSVFIS